MDVLRTDQDNEETWPTPDEFEALCRVLQDGVVLFSLDRRFVQANEAFLEMVGYSLEELRNMTFPDITPAEFAEIDNQRFVELLNRGKTGPFRKQYRRKSGEHLWVEVIGTLTLSAKGTRRIWTLIRNVDAEQRKEMTIREQNSQLEDYLSLLRATIESTAEGILVTDRDKKIRTYNRKFMDLWRVSREILDSGDSAELIGKIAGQLIPQKHFLGKISALDTTPEAESFDLLEFKDGRVYERHSRPQILNEEVVGRVWSFRDITERKRAERSLQDSEERFRSLSESSFEGLVLHDYGKVLLANQSALSMFGYDVRELTGKPILTLISPQWREIALKNVLRGNEGPYEAMGMRKDGAKFWIEVRARSSFYRGIPVRIASIRDITERRNFEEKLMLSEQEFRTSFEMAAVGVSVGNPKTERIVRVNRKFCQITGYTADELVGMRFIDLTHPDERVGEYDLWHSLIRGECEAHVTEKRYVRKDGSTIWVNVHVAPVRDQKGRVMSTFAVVEDITDRKKAELERDLLLGREMRNRENATFLSEAWTTVASSLDCESTLSGISKLVVPRLADFFWLWLAEDQWPRFVSSSIDLRKSETIKKLEVILQGLTKSILSDQPALYAAVEQGQLYPESETPIFNTKDPFLFETIRCLGFQSLITVPLTVRGRTLGEILFASTTPGRQYNQEDFELATHFSRICATSIDNASLYRTAQRSIALRDDFIEMASHELRTPLTPLKLRIQLLRKHVQFEGHSQDKVGTLKEILCDSELQIERLRTLVENLLDVSRIIANQFELSWKKTSTWVR